MRKILYRYASTLILLLLAAGLYGQPRSSGPYRLEWKRELGLGSVAIGAAATGYLLEQAEDPIPYRSLALPAVPSFDRTALGRNSEAAVASSDVVAYGTLAAPLLLLTKRRVATDYLTLGVMFAETLVLNQGVTDIIKAVVRRPRPYLYAASLPPDLEVTAYDRSSYLSNHTSTTAAAAFFAGRVFADYHPDSKLKPYVWAASAALPAVAGYLRVRGGQHFPSDVVAGYGLGAAIGYAIPLLHHRGDRTSELSVVPTGTGILLIYRFTGSEASLGTADLLQFTETPN